MASIKTEQGNVESYEVPADLIQNIMNYLGSRPFIEVFTLIQGLQTQAIPNFEQQENKIPDGVN